MVLCRGMALSREKERMSSMAAVPAGVTLFFRPLDSSALQAVMASMMSGVIPAFACSMAYALDLQLSGEPIWDSPTGSAAAFNLM